MGNNKKVTIVINRNGMGQAEPELSMTLIKNYLILLQEGDLPSYICFYAEGVKLTLADSPVVEELRALEKLGVTIFICKTCLNFYNALDKVGAGTIATMVDIMGAQTNCDKVIVL